MKKSYEPTVTVYLKSDNTKVMLARTQLELASCWIVVAVYPHALGAPGYPPVAIKHKRSLMQQLGIEKGKYGVGALQPTCSDDREKFLINGVWRPLARSRVRRAPATFCSPPQPVKY